MGNCSGKQTRGCQSAPILVDRPCRDCKESRDTKSSCQHSFHGCGITAYGVKEHGSLRDTFRPPSRNNTASVNCNGETPTKKDSYRIAGDFRIIAGGDSHRIMSGAQQNSCIFGGHVVGTRKESTPVKNPVVTRRKSLETLVRYHTHDISLDYEINEKDVCGSGYSGPVLIAKSKSHGHTNKQYAVKTFKKRELCPKKMQFLKSEVNIYLKLDHPHITRLFEVYESDEKVYLVMEFCSGGELYHRLSQKKIFSERTAAETCYQMLLGLSYLHNNNIVHRDLKLENWLYESKREDAKLKLIDFGFSKVFDNRTRMHQACGSVAYVAPEVLRRSYTGGGCDLWSLGVIVFMLLSGYPPFYAKTEDKMIVLIEKGKYCMRPERWDRIGAEAKDFVKRLLDMDENRRMTAEVALKHPWIQMRSGLVKPLVNGQPPSPNHQLPANFMNGLRQYAGASHLKRAVLHMIAFGLDSTEIADLREIFLTIDKTRCGTISLVDFRAAIKETNSAISTNEIRQVFKCLDPENHGCIEYSALIAALLQSQVGLKSGLIRDAFEKFDTAGNGVLTAQNLENVLGQQFENTNMSDVLSEACVLVAKSEASTYGGTPAGYSNSIGGTSPKACLYYNEFVQHISSAADLSTISTIAGPSMATSSNASTASDDFLRTVSEELMSRGQSYNARTSLRSTSSITTAAITASQSSGKDCTGNLNKALSGCIANHNSTLVCQSSTTSSTGGYTTTASGCYSKLDNNTASIQNSKLDSNSRSNFVAGPVAAKPYSSRPSSAKNSAVSFSTHITVDSLSACKNACIVVGKQNGDNSCMAMKKNTSNLNCGGITGSGIHSLNHPQSIAKPVISTKHIGLSIERPATLDRTRTLDYQMDKAITTLDRTVSDGTTVPLDKTSSLDRTITLDKTMSNKSATPCNLTNAGRPVFLNEEELKQDLKQEFEKDIMLVDNLIDNEVYDDAEEGEDSVGLSTSV